jgi:hypothetical protein
MIEEERSYSQSSPNPCKDSEKYEEQDEKLTRLHSFSSYITHLDQGRANELIHESRFNICKNKERMVGD